MTRGYVCLGGVPGSGVVIGRGPTVVGADDLQPKIDRGKELVVAGPSIVSGEELTDPDLVPEIISGPELTADGPTLTGGEDLVPRIDSAREDDD